MTRPPLPTHPSRRPAPARAAGAAGVVLLATALLALAGCQDDTGAPIAAAAASPPAPQRPAVADVPPPPQIQGLMTSPEASAPSGSASAAALVSTRTQLESLLAGAASCSSDDECKTVAIGGKACGGPTAYRAYSTTGPNAAQIPALAQKERELSLAEARAAHRASPCFMLADPGGHCEANRCQTGPAASVK